MEQKNIEIILSALAEKISELELEVSLRDYDIKKLKEENTTLRREITARLLGVESRCIEEAEDGKL